MHIPDGFLTAPVWLAFDAISAPAVAWIGRAGKSDTPALRAPLLGIMGAFVFAAQMINFPVALGASGHLLGGTLLSVVVGPRSAALTMTAILVLQALLFQDGGVLALGANVFNMALVGVLLGYLPVRVLGRSAASVLLGGLLSVTATGGLALTQLAISGVSLTANAWRFALLVFTLTGVLEGAITVAALRAIERLNPAAVPMHAPISARARYALAAAAIVLATCGVWFASGAPDGLEALAQMVGLQEQTLWKSAPFSGYELSSVGPDWLRRPLAGAAGVVAVYAVCALGGKRRS